MSEPMKTYKSVRLPVDTHNKLDRLKRRQDLRIYESQPGGTSIVGGATYCGVVLMALELLEKAMDAEDGLKRLPQEEPE